MPYRGKKNYSVLEKKIIRLLWSMISRNESLAHPKDSGFEGINWPVLSRTMGMGREKLYRMFKDQNYGISWEDVSKLTKKLGICLIIHGDKATIEKNSKKGR